MPSTRSLLELRRADQLDWSGAVIDASHGPGLDKQRWMVARSLSWLHQFKRLRIRWEHRADIHQAFLKLACCLICWRYLLAASC